MFLYILRYVHYEPPAMTSHNRIFIRPTAQPRSHHIRTCGQVKQSAMASLDRLITQFWRHHRHALIRPTTQPWRDLILTLDSLTTQPWRYPIYVSHPTQWFCGLFYNTSILEMLFVGGVTDSIQEWGKSGLSQRQPVRLSSMYKFILLTC